MKHPRAELIAKWLEDTTQPIWYFTEASGWYDATFEELLRVYPNQHYAVGDKPTEPPQKMCTLAGVSFPVPSTIHESCGVSITVWRHDTDDSATHYVYGFSEIKDASSCAKAIGEVMNQAIKEAK